MVSEGYLGEKVVELSLYPDPLWLPSNQKEAGIPGIQSLDTTTQRETPVNPPSLDFLQNRNL